MNTNENIFETFGDNFDDKYLQQNIIFYFNLIKAP